MLHKVRALYLKKSSKQEEKLVANKRNDNNIINNNNKPEKKSQVKNSKLCINRLRKLTNTEKKSAKKNKIHPAKSKKKIEMK